MSEQNNKKINVSDFVLAFLLPTIVGKGLLLWFGALYSDNPGEGYGYIMIAVGLFTLTMIGRFLWKYRHYKND